MATRWVVPPIWRGRTVVVAANGPSANADDLARVRGRAPLIVVNDVFRLAPWADLLYACDNVWWETHAQQALRFPGLKVGLKDEIQFRSVLVPQRAKGTDPKRPHRVVDRASPWSSDPAALATGENGGYQAVNLALLAGAARVALLFFDMRAAPDGRRHWFGDHPAGMNNPDDRLFARWIGHFRNSPPPPGTEIVNCTPGSALDCYPFMDLEAALGAAQEAAACA